jgi:hypothetical protein
MESVIIYKEKTQMSDLKPGDGRNKLMVFLI